jgi:hypothetical protein
MNAGLNWCVLVRRFKWDRWHLGIQFLFEILQLQQIPFETAVSPGGGIGVLSTPSTMYTTSCTINRVLPPTNIILSNLFETA